jgi:hypothetical protein
MTTLLLFAFSYDKRIESTDQRMDDRIKDFFLYTVLEQEKKMLEKVKASTSIITNPIPLWYSYSSAFASTTMSMRLPIWFICCIWSQWNPALDTKSMVGILPTPDAQGASLALLSALDLPRGITPARHVTCVAKWFLKLIISWNKERASVLAPFSLETSWDTLEPRLAEFYLSKINEAMVPDYKEKMWSLCSEIKVEMPQQMTPDMLMVHLLGAPVAK